MHSPNSSSQLSTQANGKIVQSVPLLNVSYSNEVDESGWDMGQLLGVFRRRLPIIIGLAIAGAAAGIWTTATRPKTYEAMFEIYMKPVTLENKVAASAPQGAGNSETPTRSNADETILEVLKSPKLVLPIIEKLKDRYPKLDYRRLSGKLELTKRKNTEILGVTYSDRNPKQVKDVMSLVSRAYLDYSLEERQADVLKGLRFVENQLPRLYGRVGSLQQTLQKFRQSYNLVTPDSLGQQLSTQLSAIQEQRRQSQINLQELQALYKNLQQQADRLSPEALAASPLSESARYQKLLNQLLEVESDIARKSAAYHVEHPNMQLLQEQRQNLIPLVKREAQQVQNELANRIQLMESRNKSLDNATSTLNQNMQEFAVVARQYDDIQRELQIATSNLNHFLSKREALRIETAQQEVPWQLLTPPTDPKYSSSNTMQFGLLGGVMGLLSGLLVAMLLDRLKNVFYTTDDIKNETNIPILGMIPFCRQLTVANNKPSDPLSLARTAPFIEAFRFLYTNIRLLNPDTPVHSLVISSSGPQDGKTTVALYLAQVAAAAGQRVLLVDVDFRRPQLHRRLNLDNNQGLSDLIAANMELGRAIQRVPSASNLFALTTGLIPPDPIRALSSQKMQNLMAHFEAVFDLVIYDTPPLLGFADANLLGSRTDGLILVVQISKTKRADLVRVLEELRISPTTVLGIAANSLPNTAADLYSTYQKPAKFLPVESVFTEKT
jgi:polysaccharide biosynthesis transport protein